MTTAPSPDFEDWVLAKPEYVADLEQAEEDLRERRTRPATEVLAEIEAEDPANAADAVVAAASDSRTLCAAELVVRKNTQRGSLR